MALRAAPDPRATAAAATLPSSSTGFVEAAACGLGWGMAPETLVAPAVRAGRVVVLEPRRWLDVPLYWQHAAVRSSTLQHITQALRTAASGTASLRTIG